MKFPKNKVKAWQILHDRTDYREINERFKISRYKLNKVFEDFEGTATTYKDLDVYYTEKLVSLNNTKITVPEGHFIASHATMIDAIRENGGKI